MIRTFAAAGLAALLSCTAFGQSGASAPKFDIADVHIAPPSQYQSQSPVLYRNGRYEYRNVSLLNLIVSAYGVVADKVIDAPSWFTSDRFDVIAKTSPDATAESLNAMLKTLLADRLKLALHNDTRPMPTYALVKGETPAGEKSPLQKAAGSAPAACKTLAAGGRGAAPGRFTDINGSPTELGPGGLIFYECRNITMPAFTELLRKMSPQDFPDPLVEQTGLTGAWDFDLTYSMMRGGIMGETRTIFVAVSQIGLKLQPAKAPMPVVVVDGANRAPTANPPNLGEMLPVRATEFESVQMSPTDTRGNMGGLRGPGPGGHVDLRGLTLKNLIANAWGVTPEQIVDGPEFMEKVYPEVIAQAPVTTTPGLRQTLDVDTNRLMMQNMLKDRFKLTIHEDQRPMDVYVLSAATPKLKKADPADGRTGCLNLDADGKELKSFGMNTERHVSCLNMTMAQFADYLPGFAPNLFMGKPRTVVNETGIEGTWDFNFTITGFGVPPGQRFAGEPQPGLPEVIASTFGLKLEVAKRPQPVMVIDHVEDKPTEK